MHSVDTTKEHDSQNEAASSAGHRAAGRIRTRDPAADNLAAGWRMVRAALPTRWFSGSIGRS